MTTTQPIMQVVLDTSVYAQALQEPGSACARVLRAAMRETRFEIVMTQDLLDALRNTLDSVNDDRQDEEQPVTSQRLLPWIRENGVFIETTKPVTDIRFEAQEQPAIAALLASGAACLVSADVGLASMHDQYNVVTPEEFLQQL